MVISDGHVIVLFVVFGLKFRPYFPCRCLIRGLANALWIRQEFRSESR